MRLDPCWISKKALLLLHEESLAMFGGERGIRYEAMLDFALAWPLNAHAHNAESTVADLAAAYAYGLVKHRPFVDGNKRAAFLSIGLFMEIINGYRLTSILVEGILYNNEGGKWTNHRQYVDPLRAIHTMLRLASGEVLSEQELAAWIAANMEKI